MEQKDMSWDTFTTIIDKLKDTSVIKLQGEGEPTLWKYWWEGVDYVYSRGHIPYSIINGSVVDIEKIIKYFKRISISLDSIDEETCKSIGRHNVKKVMQNILLLKSHKQTVVDVQITNVGQDLKSTLLWLKENNIFYNINQLSVKSDYVSVYPENKKIIFKVPDDKAKAITCDFLNGNKNNPFYTIDGVELPCCYIKEPQGFSREAALLSFKDKIVPNHCLGCKHIRKIK
jgi:MoaA/NifB/PqqE/SkfB family radical SAM enzyme